LFDTLHIGEINVRPSVEFTEDEVGPIRFEIRPFREADAVILGVEFESGSFERDRRTRVIIVVFAVAGWARSRVSVASFAVPPAERFSEFLKDSLCSKIEDFCHHENLRFSNELD